MKEFDIEEIKKNRFRTLREVCELLDLDVNNRINLESIVDVKYILCLKAPIAYVDKLTVKKEVKSFEVNKETRDLDNGE